MIYPEVLIIETKSIVEEFISSTNNVLSKQDLVEVITQIADRYVNNEVVPANVVNTDRLINKGFLSNEQNHSAAITLDFKLKQRLVGLNAFVNGEFPYFFSKLLGNDVVFKHLPY